MATIKISKNTNSKYYYQIMTDEMPETFRSDGYVKKTDCLIAIEQARLFINDKTCIRIQETADRKWRFVVTGSDRSVVGRSAPFNSQRQCFSYIIRMRNDLNNADIISE